MSKLAIDPSAIKAFVFDVDGVLSASTLQIGEDGQPIRTTNLHDGYAIRTALAKGYKIAVITGGKTEAVIKRCRLLGIADIFSDSPRKLPVFSKWIESVGLDASEVAYMGDDIPDLTCLRAAGLSAAPHDAVTEVLQTATFISKFGGGYGCARDLIESVMRAQGTWESSFLPTAAI